MKNIIYNNEVVNGLVKSIIKNRISRNMLMPKLDAYIQKKKQGRPDVVNMYKYYALKAMYTSFFKNYDKRLISPKVIDRITETLLNSVLLDKKDKEKSKEIFKNKNNQEPPTFITISPTKRCNLNCIGCYASSNASNTETLSWTLLNKIIEDGYSNMGMRFFVISGGEPLMYKSENKTILDLAEKWSDCFFLMYTNGTLIKNDIARQMASLGNITPAISVEGFEEETDRRRGKGVYQKIINAKNRLIENGVPFGLSVTATKENIHLLLDKSFYEYYFNEFGTTYMWMFHFMPIGKTISTELMITPEQRIALFKVVNRMLIDNYYFIADFWNSAMMSNGCIAYGKKRGYFYINWDGNIMPCVFVPYYVHNVYDLYKNNQTLNDALYSKFFVKGREWQDNYLQNKGNLLMPCSIRDHYKAFYERAKNTGVKPENEAAGEAIYSEAYRKALINFDEELEAVSSNVWKELNKKAHNQISNRDRKY